MLSLGGALAPQAQTVAQGSAEPPAQARLSLFDLAEAAATLSTASRQASRATPNSKPSKGKAQAANDTFANQSAPAVPKGPRSVRKSKGDSSSPDAEAAGVNAVPAAASSDGMQTRGLANRRPSVEKQPSGRSALPSKPKANADKTSKAQKQMSQPSIAHTASAATQNASPAGSKSADAAQALAAMPSTSGAGVPGLKEEVSSTPALVQPVSSSRKLLPPEKAPKVTEHSIPEPGQSLSLAESLAGGPSQEPAVEATAAPASQAAEGKPKKHKRTRKEKDSNSSQPASHAHALAATAAGGKAVPAAGKQHSQIQQTNSTVPSPAEALAGAVAP